MQPESSHQLRMPPHVNADDVGFLENFIWDGSPQTLEQKVLKADIRFGRSGNNYISAKKAVATALFFGFDHVYLLKKTFAFSLESDFVSETRFLDQDPVLAFCADHRCFFTTRLTAITSVCPDCRRRCWILSGTRFI